MKKNQNLVLSGLVLVLAVGVSATALAGWKDKLKLPAASTGGSTAGVEAEQTALVKSFSISQSSLVEAQILIAEALGLKESRDALEAVSATMGKGNTEPSKDAIKKSIQTTNEANENISKMIKEGATLDAAGKKKLAQSFAPYAVSLAAGGTMVPEAFALAKVIEEEVKSASIMSVLGIKKTFDVGLYLAPRIPGHFANQGEQLQSVMAFARNNNVEIPSEAEIAAKLDF